MLDKFKKSIRIVLNIKNKFPYEIAYKFTESKDNVMNAKDSHTLKKKIIDAINATKG